MKYATQEIPIKFCTDRFELQLFPTTGVILFKRLEIYMGEIVSGKTMFTLRKNDFKRYPGALKALAEVINLWIK